jgi:hypothetical protein
VLDITLCENKKDVPERNSEIIKIFIIGYLLNNYFSKLSRAEKNASHEYHASAGSA